MIVTIEFDEAIGCDGRVVAVEPSRIDASGVKPELVDYARGVMDATMKAARTVDYTKKED